MALHEQLYNYILYISWGLYIITLLGISFFSPKYLSYFREFIKIYISGLLIYKFNPFYNKTGNISEFDRKIVFSAGIYLLMTTTIISIIEKLYFDTII